MDNRQRITGDLGGGYRRPGWGVTVHVQVGVNVYRGTQPRILGVLLQYSSLDSRGKVATPSTSYLDNSLNGSITEV